jgi:hypothetical protein
MIPAQAGIQYSEIIGQLRFQTMDPGFRRGDVSHFPGFSKFNHLPAYLSA